MSAGNKFVLVKGRAGLGNRILSALTGVLYARLSGRRLLVDWSDGVYAKGRSNVFHHYFQSPLCDPSERIPETDSVRPSLWRGHLHESAFRVAERHGRAGEGNAWREFSVDLKRLDYPEEVVVFWAFHAQVDDLRGHFPALLPQFQEVPTDAILRTLLRDDLVLHPQIRERVEAFAGVHFASPTIGVHVRYTDHRTHLLGSLAAVDTLLRQRPELNVFLATDNIQVKTLFEESYPGTITTSHWYPRSGFRLHQNKDCPDPVESGIDALVDLYLLARCEYLVIDSSSSFGRLARLPTEMPSAHIVDVRRTGRAGRRIRSITWSLWLRSGLFEWGLWALRQAVRRRKRQERRLSSAVDGL